MKELNTWQTLLMQTGALLILAGLVLWLPARGVAPYVYSVGAIAFSAMQMLARYEGTSAVVKRLRRQQMIGALLLVVTGGLMFLGTLRLGFLQHNEWLACLAVAAVFEVYTAFRLPVALKKK